MGKKRFVNGGNVTVEHEPNGMNGRDCVMIHFKEAGIQLRFTLEDAETLGEAMVRVVRAAEELVQPDDQRP